MDANPEGLSKLIGRKQVLIFSGMWFAKDLEGWPLYVVAGLAVAGAGFQFLLDWKQSRKDAP